MKVSWIIENFAGDNGYEDLIAEVRKQGMTCHVLDITNHFDLNQKILAALERRDYGVFFMLCLG